MHPFQGSYPRFPNQNQTEVETKNSAPQQVKMPNPNNHANNQAPCNPQPIQNNPHYPIQSNNPNLPYNGNGNPNNHQLPMQNMQMPFPQSQFFPQMQGHYQNTPQNGVMSHPFFANSNPQAPNRPFGQLNYRFPHPNQMNGFPYGQFPQQLMGFPQVQPFNMLPCLHPSMGALPPGSQNAFLMNPQSVMGNPNQIAQNAPGQNICVPSAMGQNGLQEAAMNGQHVQKNPVSSLNNGHAQMQQIQNNMQSGVLGKSQGNHAIGSGGNISNINGRNPQENDFTRNKQNYPNGESRNTRFQKTNNHPVTNSKGNFRSFEGKGSNDKGSKNPHQSKNNPEAGVEKQSARSIPFKYAQEEIQKWRDERRKNFPLRSKIEKKPENQANSESVDLEAQKRRKQELKEILAKQAELGVEVAQIPKVYLMDSENQTNETEQNAASAEKSCNNRGGKKQKHLSEPEKQTDETEQNAASAETSYTNRGGGKQKHPLESERQTNETKQNAEKSFKKRAGKRQKRNRSNMKQKAEGNDSSPRPEIQKKNPNPTLLQKLLSADIKRDKSQLLQAFRFMVSNNFFVDPPKKPLEFPSITVKSLEASAHHGNVLVSSITKADKSEVIDEHDTSHEDIVDINDPGGEEGEISE